MQKRFVPDEGGVFPEWEEVTLGDILEINPKTEEKIADEFYYADLASINNGVFAHGAAINHNEAPGRAQRVVHIDDVLFQSVNAENLGHYHYTKDKELDKQFVASTGFFLLRMKNGCNAFLYQLLFTKAFNQEVHKYSAGSIYPAVNITEFKKIKVRIPKSIEEQRKIAVALAAYDEMIAVKTAKLEVWQECKKRMVKEIFGRKKRFKDDGGREFPEWEEKTLGNVSTVKRGKGYAKKDLTDKGAPIILYGRLYTKYETKIENVDTFADVQKNSIVSIGGEVIIPTSGENSEDIARAAAVEQQGVLIGGDLCVIMPNKDMFDSTFLAYAITYSKSHKDLVKKANGEIIAHLRVEDIKNLSVSLPCTEEQQKIVSFLAKIDNEIEIQKEFIKTYADGKRRMMRELIE